MGSIFLLALWAAIYPTLLACVVVIPLLPRHERLLLGFWLGAMAMSVTCGLIIVFTLGVMRAGSRTVRADRRSSPPGNRRLAPRPLTEDPAGQAEHLNGRVR
jgi:hypothetical protein